MAMDKKIALLIPCYNCEKYIRRVVESARCQTVPFDEIWCYDDCSTDATLEVLNELGVNVIEGKENMGPMVGRNRLMHAAKTEYVHFHDADDPFHDTRFVEKLSGYLTPNTAAFSQWERRSEEGESRIYDYAHVDEDTDWIACWIHSHVHLNAIIFPRQKFMDIGGFNENLILHEDLFNNMQLSLKGLEYKLVPEVLAIHIRNSESWTSRTSKVVTNLAGATTVKLLFFEYPEKYREMLSEKFIYHVKELITVGAKDEINEVIIFAKNLSTRSRHFGGMERLINKLFGVYGMLRYAQLRSKFS